ncbi:phenylacetic acid degradation protein [Mycobacterium malmoense]|uniref:PaaI family thioesterase n=1 Tax=Mycobacterium malmoense TaxID=1780 RepID=UPI00080BF76E|nr:PaaI family thioesterase [Mycobacterium malmoense]OCB26413.1 phenylacetic acid degradation protein [Mycobacterium malmoense]
MTEMRADAGSYIDPPIHLNRRFGIEVLNADQETAVVEMSMPFADLRNPFTDLPTLGPLGLLIDSVSGMSNHFRCREAEWTVSTELALELSPEASEWATATGACPVVAAARPLGPRTSGSALSVCTLTCGDVVIGGGMVRSYYVRPEALDLSEPAETVAKSTATSLAEMMAVEPMPTAEGVRVLRQHVDPFLNNAIGVINGGITSTGLELTASAMVNTGGVPMRTASVKVNFLRPFYAGDRSRYEAAPLRIGRNTAVADAHAIGDDGKPAVTARVTAYR